MIRRLAALAVGLVLLAGCGSIAPAPGQESVEPTTPSLTSTVPVVVSKPTKLIIPSIGASSSAFTPSGLNPDGSPAVPSLDDPKQASWYDKGPVPGQIGPALILGHIDGHKIEGVFFHLRDIKINDLVEIDYEDGSVKHFKVTDKIQVKKSEFPAQKLFAFVPDAQLRLVTCGGDFDPVAHSYKDNWIVSAVLVS